MDKIMLTCREVSWLSSKELDTRLPFLTRVQIKMHVTMCKTCYRYRKQLTAIRSMVGKVAPAYDALIIHEKSENLPEESRERIKKFLKSKTS